MATVNDAVGLAANAKAAAGRALAGAPTLLVLGDSILAQSVYPPNQGFGATTAKGSYFDASAVIQRGVTDIFAENPARLKTRAAHLLATGDEIWLQQLSAGNELGNKRYTVTVLDADEFTLDGVDATGIAAFTSASAATDGVASVDMANSNFGLLTWMNYFLGQPWDSVTMRAVAGRTTAQVAAAIRTDIGSAYYSDAMLLVGRNDGTTYDEASLDTIYAALGRACDHINVVLPYPDQNVSSGALTKLAQIGSYWHGKQASDPKVRVIDLFGVISDAAATNQAGRSELLSADLVHPRGNGALAGGWEMALSPRLRQLNGQRQAASLAGVQLIANGNIINNGRLSGVSGSVQSPGTGVAPNGWTLGNRSSTAVTGFRGYPCRTPARMRLNSTAYAVGDTISLPEHRDSWFLCITAGTSDASQPAAFATLALWDWTGATDGTAVFVKIPRFTTSQKWTYWYLIEATCSDTSPSTSRLSFSRTPALSGTVAVGDHLRAEADLVMFNQCPTSSLILSLLDGGAAQIAAGIDLAANSAVYQWPFNEPLVGSLKTPDVRVPTGAATLDIRLTIGANSLIPTRVAIANILVTEA